VTLQTQYNDYDTSICALILSHNLRNHRWNSDFIHKDNQSLTSRLVFTTLYIFSYTYCKMTNVLLGISNPKVHYVCWQHCLVFCDHHHNLQNKSNTESNADITMLFAFAHSAFFCHNIMRNSLVMKNCEQLGVRRIISAAMMCTHYNTLVQSIRY